MKKNNILIIGDTQFPYEHTDYLGFCKAVSKRFQCGRHIHIGDIADCLNFSNYDKDPSSPSIPEEIDNLKCSFNQWKKVFPKMECVVGNHDRRIRRKLDLAGFSEDMLSTEHVFRHVMGLPEKWNLYEKIKIKTKFGVVYAVHGDEKGSSVTAGQTSRKFGASLIRGHHHSKFFIYYISTPHQLTFDMIVGCGIDKNSIAFKYNRKDIDRPILGCGVLIDGIPVLVPMNLNNNGRWTGRLST